MTKFLSGSAQYHGNDFQTVGDHKHFDRAIIISSKCFINSNNIHISSDIFITKLNKEVQSTQLPKSISTYRASYNSEVSVNYYKETPPIPTTSWSIVERYILFWLQNAANISKTGALTMKQFKEFLPRKYECMPISYSTFVSNNFNISNTD